MEFRFDDLLRELNSNEIDLIHAQYAVPEMESTAYTSYGDFHAIGSLSSESSRDLRERICKAKALPKDPTSRDAIEIEEINKKTTEGKRFLLLDISTPVRIIAFASKKGLELLAKSNYWMADGTFKSSTKLFYQVFIIHCWYIQRRHACVYAFMESENEEC